METQNVPAGRRVPWNKGKLTGQKPPLKLREIWAIRTRLQMSSNVRELAIFNLAIDSKLRACDLTRLHVQDVCQGSHVASRATILQQKTKRPVQFEITEQTRQSVEAWIAMRALKPEDYLFPSRLRTSPHLSTRQYARLVHRWVASIGLDDAAYGTHHAAYKGLTDLPAHQKSSCSSVAARTYEARKHRPVSRH
jgi:integrase